MRTQLTCSSLVAWLVLACGLWVSGCAQVAFEQGESQLDGTSLVFGRLLLDRDGERLVVSPFSMPVALRKIDSSAEPKMLLESFDKDGSFRWALAPGLYQFSLVLYSQREGVVSFAFNVEKPGTAYYFGDLTVYGRKKFDSLGSANMRDIHPVFVDAFAEAKAQLLSLNPQIDATAVHRLLLNNMLDPFQRGELYAEAMEQREPCCAEYSQLAYTKLPLAQRVSARIGPDSPLFRFPEGNSRWVAWELPLSTEGKTLVLRSLATPSALAGTGHFYVFSPIVSWLDENFSVLDEPRRNLFSPMPASLAPPRSAALEASIALTGNLARARYVIMHTGRSVLEQPWRTTRPGTVPTPAGVLPTGMPLEVEMEPAISGVVEAEIRDTTR